MSDGRKAAYDDAMEELRVEEMDFFSKKSASQIRSFYNNINESLRYFLKSNPSLTVSQHDRIKEIKEQLENFKS